MSTLSYDKCNILFLLMLYLVKQLSTLLPLCCHSLLNIGIVRMDGRLPRRPSNKHHHHGGAVHYYSGMSMTNQPALSTGASLEGVGRGRYSRISFNNAYRSLQKLISKWTILFYIYLLSTSIGSKTMNSHLPHGPHSLHLLSFLYYAVYACLWLVVVYVFQSAAIKGRHVFCFWYFSSIDPMVQTTRPHPPMRSPPLSPPL